MYIAIDLKSYYASVECVQRHMDPLTTNLLVADESRSDKTICLAVSPSLRLIENWAGKRLLAFSPALSPAVQQLIAAKLGIDLTLPHKTFNARGTAFYLQTRPIKASVA